MVIVLSLSALEWSTDAFCFLPTSRKQLTGRALLVQAFFEPLLTGMKVDSGTACLVDYPISITIGLKYCKTETVTSGTL